MTEHLLGLREHLGFLLALLLLSLFGVAMVYSAGVLNTPDPAIGSLWIRQAAVLGLGVAAAATTAQLPLRAYQGIALPAYLVSVGLLLATLILGMGAGTASGVRSFISVAGFRFQPAEAAKLGTVLALAALLASRKARPKRLGDLFLPGVLVGLPLALVLLQPDVGTAMAFVGLFFATVFWARAPWQLMLFAASPGISLLLSFNTLAWSAGFVLLAVGLYLHRFRLTWLETGAVVAVNLAAGAVARPLWLSLAEYQRNRLLVFLDPERDSQGAGWQLIQSKVAIGSGGLLGQGFTEGPQKRLHFLPEQHTDFIFSVVGEELGFVGTALALVLFGYVFFKLIEMAEAAKHIFAGLVIYGLLGMWVVHAVVNIGMTVGVVPITGIPLPFISYGGSFLLVSWVGAGIAVAVSRYED